MNNLYVIRVKNKLSQEQLAKVVGTSRSTITGIESGKRQVKLTLAKKIAKALNTTIDKIFPN